MYLNPIQFSNLSSIQVKLHAVSFKIFIQMELNFHTINCRLFHHFIVIIMHSNMEPSNIIFQFNIILSNEVIMLESFIQIFGMTSTFFKEFLSIRF
jgi:hypothetical protein